MQQYLMQMRSTTTGLGWTYLFHQPSDEMAIQYVEKVAASDRTCGPGMMGIDLFYYVDGEATGHVAYIEAQEQPRKTAAYITGTPSQSRAV